MKRTATLLNSTSPTPGRTSKTDFEAVKRFDEGDVARLAKSPAKRRVPERAALGRKMQKLRSEVKVWLDELDSRESPTGRACKR